MNPMEKMDHFISSASRDNAVEWVKLHVDTDVDADTWQTAVSVVAAKIEEIVRDPASRNYGFRKAHVYLQSCKFVNGELVYTEPEAVGLILEHR